MSRELTDLLAAHQPHEDIYLYCTCGVRVASDGGYPKHLAELIAAEFVVAPRAEVQRFEFGWSYAEPGHEPRHYRAPDRETAELEAAHIRRVEEGLGRPATAVLLSRPVLPWTTEVQP